MLQEVISPLRCAANPVTKEPSALHASLIKFTVQESEAHVCYPCAQPIIDESRRRTRPEHQDGPRPTERTSRTDTFARLHDDLHDLATGQPNSIPQVQNPSCPPVKYPWGSTQHVGKRVRHHPTKGRWDMNRTNQEVLNQWKLTVYIIHKDKPPPNTSLDIQKQARELAGIFSRISSPITPSAKRSGTYLTSSYVQPSTL